MKVFDYRTIYSIELRAIYRVELRAFILISLLFVLFFNIQRANEREKWVKHSNEVLLHTARIQNMANETEESARNFSLTGNSRFIVQYKIAASRMMKEQYELKKLTLDNIYLKSPLDSLTMYLLKRLEFCRQLINAGQQKTSSPTAFKLEYSLNSVYVNPIATFIELIERNENKLMEIRKARSQKAVLIINGSFLAIIAFVIVVIVILMRKSKVELQERKQMVMTLFKNDERMKEVEKIASFGAWSINLENGEISSSDEMYRIWGYHPGEKRSTIDNYMAKVHPDDCAFVKRKMEKIPFQTGTDEYTFRLVDDDVVKYVRTGITVIRDDEGKLLSVAGYVQNITEKILAEIEREKIIGQVVQRNKTLEQFAHMVSHNLRAPVANIIGLGQVMQITDSDDQEAIIKHLLSSVNSFDHMLRDLNMLLQVRRQVNEPKENVVFSNVVMDVKHNLHSLLDSRIVEITTDFSEADQLFTVNSYLYNIFYNIILNSINYSEEDRTCLIKIKTQLASAHIMLTFEDNGKGIDLEKNGSLLFELYSHFDTNIKGKGMGLFLIKTQIELLGGTITVKSGLGLGSQFNVTLPVNG